jgi:hypothetical protein
MRILHIETYSDTFVCVCPVSSWCYQIHNYPIYMQNEQNKLKMYYWIMK